MNTEITKEQAISRAFEILKGREVTKGTVVGMETEKFTHTFDRYDGDDAIVVSKDGEEKRWPRSEIFDANKVINVANHVLNLGWWKEGQESTIVTIKA